MTPDERKQMEDRLKAATEQESRLKKLKEAIDKLTGDKIHSLKFPVRGEDAELFYSTVEDDERFCRVCWLDQEPGMVTDIRAALLSILEKRLAEAQERYDAV